MSKSASSAIIINHSYPAQQGWNMHCLKHQAMVSTCHKEAVNSSQENKQANNKAVLPQQYNYPYP